jgi:GntR family transcriptional regulator
LLPEELREPFLLRPSESAGVHGAMVEPVRSAPASIACRHAFASLLTSGMLCRTVCVHSYRFAVVLKLRIDDSGIPIYVQIRDQLLRAIGAGVLRPGEQLPTMRELAVQLKVDLNTVRHAYDELEQTGAIVIVRARGTYVADRPPPVDGARQARKVQALAQQAIALVQAAGIDPAEVAQEMLQLAKRNGAKP